MFSLIDLFLRVFTRQLTFAACSLAHFMEMRLRKRRRGDAPPLERHKRYFMQMSSSCTLFQPAGQRLLHLWRLQGYLWSECSPETQRHAQQHTGG